MQYAGAWLTLFFHKPAIGASILAAIWVLIFYVGTKAFRLQGNAAGASALMLLPVACLLTSVVDLGYWIYISTIRGYWFSQSVGYLVMLLLLWAARQTPRKWHFVWYVLGFCIYPILGWFALLFILCLILTEKLSWQEILGVVLLIFTASIWHTQFYSNQKFDDVMLAGLPRFMTPSDHTPHLSYPFWALAIVSALIPLCSGYLAKAQTAVKVFVPILCAAAGIFFTWSQMYHDLNYIDEMRMVRYAEDDNWKEVLQIAEGNKKPTTTIVFLKNVALMNEGGLLDRSFKIGNIEYPPHNPDSVHSSFLDIERLVTHETFRGQGIGRLLYEKAVQKALEDQVPVLAAAIETIPYNERSLGFHKAMGFEEAGRILVRNETVEVSLQTKALDSAASRLARIRDNEKKSHTVLYTLFYIPFRHDNGFIHGLPDADISNKFGKLKYCRV